MPAPQTWGNVDGNPPALALADRGPGYPLEVAEGEDVEVDCRRPLVARVTSSCISALLAFLVARLFFL